MNVNKAKKLIETYDLDVTRVLDCTNNKEVLMHFLYGKLFDFLQRDFSQFNEKHDDQWFENNWLTNVDYDHKDRKYFIYRGNWYQMSKEGDDNQYQVFSSQSLHQNVVECLFCCNQ